jgi:hypothetical protein
MDTRTTRSTAENAVKTAFYYHERYEAYECLGCGEFIEIPGTAVLKGGHGREPIKGNPENLLLWCELMVETDHAACGRFKDARMAEQARPSRRAVA